MKRSWRLLYLYACGLFAALPVSFSALSFLSFVSFVPALVLLFAEWQKEEDAKPRRYYGAGLGFCMGFFMMTFHWFLSLWPLDFVGGMTPLGAAGVIVAAAIGLPLLQSLGFALLFYGMARLARTRAVRRAPLLLPLLFAAGWAVYAYTQTLTWAGVPWGANLALAQYENLWFISTASLFGSHFVTFVIALINGMLAYGILCFMRGEHKTVRVAAIVCLSLFFGNTLLSGILYLIPIKSENTATVAVLQGNFSSAEKWEAGADPVTRYCALAREAAEAGATLMVWPETAIPYDFMNDAWAKANICEMAKETGTTQIVGAFAYEKNADGEWERYNALYLIRPDGSIAEERYYKRHLVPFGEYVPMEALVRTLLPFLSNLEMLSDGSQMTAGDSPALFYEEAGVIGGLICFDSIYPELARDSVGAGAELLVLGTNDSWFFSSAAVYQHNGQAVLRAIENGRCLVRAANTGISSIISEKGDILTEIPPLIAGQATANVQLSKNRTLYSYIGDTFVLLCQIGFLLPFAWELYKKVRETHE